jgi:hypothetical protein
VSVRLLAVVISCAILCFVIELIRREKLTFAFAFGWIIVCVLGIFFSIFNQLLFKLAAFFGFELPSNFIFFSLLSVFVFLTLLLTIFLSQQSLRNDRMAQKISLMEHEIKKLRDK